MTNVVLPLGVGAYLGGKDQKKDPMWSLTAKIDDVMRSLRRQRRAVEIPSNTSGELLEASYQFSLALSNVSMHLKDSFRNGLLAQARELYDPEAWDDRDRVPVVGAFETFSRMLMLMHVRKRPGIGTDGHGAVTAMWIDGPNKLVINCSVKGRVDWMLIKNGERAAAAHHVDRLPEALKPYAPSTWLSDAE